MSLKSSVAEFYQRRHTVYGTAPGADNAHARIPPLVGSNKRVLDVGCGSGLLGAELKAAGNTVVGIELAEDAATAARSRLDQVVVASLDDPAATLPPGPFDAIVCADILEHLFDPEGALRRLTPLLSDDGIVVLSLPNVAHFSVRLGLLFGMWEYQDIGILDRGHLRFYTNASALQLLDNVGLEVIRHDSALSIPFASRPVRYVIDLCKRLPMRWRQRMAPLIAAQLIYVAKKKAAHSGPIP